VRNPLLFGLLVALVSAACGADFSESDTLGAATAQEQALVVVSLRFNDSVLRVHGDQTFTLEDGEGTLLAERVTREELDALAPAVAERYERMVAGWAAGPLDASLDHWLLAPEGGSLETRAP
jgi:hypothetical protein